MTISPRQRMFESVIQSWFAALEAGVAPGDVFRETCRYTQENPGDPFCDGDALFLWVDASGGAVSPLCRRHADAWMDDEQRRLVWQPPVLIPLKKRESS